MQKHGECCLDNDDFVLTMADYFAIRGIRLVSEVAGECFKTAFVSGSHEVCDYYTCNTCSLKWASRNDGIRIQNEELCIKNEELCI